MRNDDKIEEYKDLGDNMRHYANMRFAQLTLYFAFTMAFLTAAFRLDPPLAYNLRLFIKILGIVTAVVFAIMDNRACTYWHWHRRRAMELEKELGFKQYSRPPVAKWFSATNATRCLLWSGVLAWALAVFCKA